MRGASAVAHQPQGSLYMCAYYFFMRHLPVWRSLNGWDNLHGSLLQLHWHMRHAGHHLTDGYLDASMPTMAARHHSVSVALRQGSNTTFCSSLDE